MGFGLSDLDPTNKGGALGGVVGGIADSIGNSVDNIFDSSGDFLRAVGRGDVGGAVSDILSIGDQITNLMTGGMWNIGYDHFRDWVLPDIPPYDYQDRLVMSRDAAAPQRIIYGECFTSGAVRFIHASGTDSEYLHLIIVMAAHPCLAIPQIYFNDEKVYENGTTIDKYKNNVVFSIQLGNQTAADPVAVANCAPKWTTNHKLLGKTYIYARLKYDTDLFKGLPTIRAIVRGKKDIYDPRTGLTGWTDNHALVTRDYMASTYGFGETHFDDESFKAGANICDQLVSAGPGKTEKRYTVNGTITIVDDPRKAHKNLLIAGAADTQYIQGRWVYVPGVYTAPFEPAPTPAPTFDSTQITMDSTLFTMDSSGASVVYDNPHFTVDDLLGGLQIRKKGDTSSIVNAARGQYLDKNQNYQSVDFVPIVIDAYVQKDKAIMYADTQLPFTTTGTAARRLAKLHLERSRYGIQVETVLGWRVLRYGVGSRITLTMPQLGWDKRVFRIAKMEISFVKGGADVILEEDHPDVWAWEEGDALEVDVPPALNLPDPSVVTAPTGLTGSEYLYIANDKKTIRSRIRLVWDGSPTIQRWALEGSYDGAAFVPLSDYLSSPIFEYNDAEVGLWDFRVRAFNGLGIASPWATLTFRNYGKTAPPADVTGFFANLNPFTVEMRWDPVPDLDLDYYEIRLGVDWDTGVTLQTLQATRWTWETRPSGQEKLWIKAKDTSGNYSLNATVANLDVDAPKSVSPIRTTVIDNNVLIYWASAETSFAISHYLIKKGADLATAETVGQVTATYSTLFETKAGEYTYWIAGVDVQGNIGPYASTVALVDQPPDFVLQADQYLDFSQATVSNMLVVENDIPGTGPFKVLAPVQNSTTWAQHYAALPGSGTTVRQKQLDNGYNHYLQPSPNVTATFEHVTDFQGQFTLSRIRYLPEVEIVAGNPVIAYTVGYSDDGVTFTTETATTMIGVNFRYVKVGITVTSTSDQDLIRIRAVRLALEVKLRDDQGRGQGLASDVDGTVVNFNTAFVDVIDISVNAISNEPIIVATDFQDVPNPTFFKVQFFKYIDGSGFVRQSVPFSWRARGV